MAEKEKFYFRVVTGIILFVIACVTAFGVNINNKVWTAKLERVRLEAKDEYFAKKLNEISLDVNLLLRQRSSAALRNKEVPGEG